MHDHARALGQKYMGIRPQGNHLDEMFRDTTFHGDSNHPVPVSNFLNAQCMYLTPESAVFVANEGP